MPYWVLLRPLHSTIDHIICPIFYCQAQTSKIEERRSSAQGNSDFTTTSCAVRVTRDNHTWPVARFFFSPFHPQTLIRTIAWCGNAETQFGFFHNFAIARAGPERSSVLQTAKACCSTRDRVDSSGVLMVLSTSTNRQGFHGMDHTAARSGGLNRERVGSHANAWSWFC